MTFAATFFHRAWDVVAPVSCYQVFSQSLNFDDRHGVLVKRLLFAQGGVWIANALVQVSFQSNCLQLLATTMAKLTRPAGWRTLVMTAAHMPCSRFDELRVSTLPPPFHTSKSKSKTTRKSKTWDYVGWARTMIWENELAVRSSGPRTVLVFLRFRDVAVKVNDSSGVS